MSSRVRFGNRKCNNFAVVCSPQSQRFSGTTFASNTFVINLVNKGNGDLINHDLNYRLRIVTFYNDGDGGRQMNDFWSDDILTNSFVLKNDFTDDKFSGKLVVVKDVNSGSSQRINEENISVVAIEDGDIVAHSLSSEKLEASFYDINNRQVREIDFEPISENEIKVYLPITESATYTFTGDIYLKRRA